MGPTEASIASALDRMLNVIDAFRDECRAIRVSRKLQAVDVIDALSDLFILQGVPGHIRSDIRVSAARPA